MCSGKASSKLKAFAREEKPTVKTEERERVSDTQSVKSSSTYSSPSPKKSQSLSQASLSTQVRNDVVILYCVFTFFMQMM